MLRRSNRVKKNDPDLVDSIVRPTHPLKEELCRMFFKMHQFGRKITKIWFARLDVRKIDGFPPEANTACEPSKFEANNGSPDSTKSKKTGSSPPGPKPEMAAPIHLFPILQRLPFRDIWPR